MKDADGEIRLDGLGVLVIIAEILFGHGIPFIFATGYGVGAVPVHLQTVPVLQKPFDRRGLERARRAALDAKGSFSGIATSAKLSA